MNPTLKKRGLAPHIARSLTVPHTAIFPMSPPGKNTGFTTKESVVKAIRPPGIPTTAESSARIRISFPRYLKKISFIMPACD